MFPGSTKKLGCVKARGVGASVKHGAELFERSSVSSIPGHLVLPAFPLCTGRILRRRISSLIRLFLPSGWPSRSCAGGAEAPSSGRPELAWAVGRGSDTEPVGRAELMSPTPERLYVVGETSRRRALCWKNSAWLITA